MRGLEPKHRSYAESEWKDVIYDVSDLGGQRLCGLDEWRDTAITLGAANPVAHLVTNIVSARSPTGQLTMLTGGRRQWGPARSPVVQLGRVQRRLTRTSRGSAR